MLAWPVPVIRTAESPFVADVVTTLPERRARLAACQTSRRPDLLGRDKRWLEASP
jgi:hypothetical protein